MSATRVRSKAAERLLNRELSWLEFNARVLELAADESVPLLERLKFASIFSFNLDEFFMVRVAGLMGQAALGFGVRSPDGRVPEEALAEIRDRVRELTAEQSRIWNRELRPALDEEGIFVRRVVECDDDEREELARRFERDVYPVLTPLALGPGQRFPYISGLSLSLGVLVRDPETGEERFARVKVPEGLPRFVYLGKRGYLVPLEAVIAHFLGGLFPQMEIIEAAVFRVTRDADFSVSDEADDLLEAVELELQRRRFGDVVRLEVAESMSDRMLDRLTSGLGIGSEQVYRIQGLLDLADLAQLSGLDRPDLKDEAWVPRTPAEFLPQRSLDLFQTIAAGDRLVHHPYDSFETTFEAFLDTASEDAAVTALKTTVYRTSDESPLVPALIRAAEVGKQSVCLVELTARFDESRNIEWSRALEHAGVHVVYGFPNLKVHAKMTLVVRREANGLRRYVHIGTGNYHSRNARIYEDFGLFTADDEIAADVADLFNYITGFGRPLEFRKLLVAPFDLRDRLIAEIRSVGHAAACGEARLDRDQGELSHRRGDHHRALPSGPGGGKDRHRREEHLLSPPRCARPERDDLRPLHRGPLPRAQPALHLPGRKEGLVLHGQPRPDAAEPRPQARGGRARGGPGASAAAAVVLRRRARRQRDGVGAPGRRAVEAPPSEEGRAGARHAHGPDEKRPAPRPQARRRLAAHPLRLFHHFDTRD